MVTTMTSLKKKQFKVEDYVMLFPKAIKAHLKKFKKRCFKPSAKFSIAYPTLRFCWSP
jgi:hypothetical protein